jgi:hypothetical protein
MNKEGAMKTHLVSCLSEMKYEKIGIRHVWKKEPFVQANPLLVVLTLLGTSKTGAPLPRSLTLPFLQSLMYKFGREGDIYIREAILEVTQ